MSEFPLEGRAVGEAGGPVFYAEGDVCKSLAHWVVKCQVCRVFGWRADWDHLEAPQ